jgi:DNA-binding response OmpR family regulator
MRLLPLQPMKSILIAEGDANVAKLFVSVFQHYDWQVTSPFDANGAAEVLRGTEHFDMMLVSYKVRGSDGLELIKLVRALDHRKRMPVLMVTGTHSIETEALAAGANEVLRKPIGMYTLMAAADKYLAGTEHQANSA